MSLTTERSRQFMRTANLALLAVLFLVGCGQKPARAPAEATGSPAPAALFDRVWLDEAGRPVTFARFRGAPLVLTMIYRSCHTRCPMTISKLQRVAGVFRARHRPVNFVLVTLDPFNDTPARLAVFKREQQLDPEFFHLLSGSLTETRELARFLSLRAAYDESHIEHEVRVAVFDASGKLVRSLEGWSFADDEPAAATAQSEGTGRASRLNSAASQGFFGRRLNPVGTWPYALAQGKVRPLREVQ